MTENTISNTLDAKLEEAHRAYASEETRIKTLIDGQHKEAEKELRALVDTYLPALAEGDTSQIDAFAQELKTKTGKIKRVPTDAIEAARQTRSTAIETAFTEQFIAITKALAERQQSLAQPPRPQEELEALNDMLTRRKPDYESAKQRETKGQTDAIDKAIITEYERANNQLDAATSRPKQITVPVRINTITTKGRLQVILPKATGSIGQELDAICKAACEENALQYAPFEDRHTTGYTLQASPEEFAKQLELQAQKNESLTKAQITLKLYRTEELESITPITYTAADLQKMFNVHRLKLTTLLYGKLGKNTVDQHSTIYQQGNKKRRQFKPSVIPLLEALVSRKAAQTEETPADTEAQKTQEESQQEETEEKAKPAAQTEQTTNADPAKYYTKAEATRLLQYVSTGAVYNNKNLVLETIDGHCYVTRESLDAFLQTNERHGTKWKPRRNSVTEEDLDGELEKPINLSKRQSSILRLHKQGLTNAEIASELKLKNRVGAKTVRRNLEMMGVYSEAYVEATFPTLDVIKQRAMPGVKTYPKDEIRLDMLETLVNEWKGKTIRYVGLEGPHFCSYIEIARVAEGQLDPKGSLIAERDEHSYHIMQSFVENWKAIEGGEIFKGLRIKYGELNKVLNAQRKGAQFNLLNLDYEGPVSGEKLNAAGTLFLRNLLDDEALLCVTLNDHPRLRSRLKDKPHSNGRGYEQGFDTDDQREIFGSLLSERARAGGYELKELAAKNYASRGSPMITITYKLWRA